MKRIIKTISVLYSAAIFSLVLNVENSSQALQKRKTQQSPTSDNSTLIAQTRSPGFLPAETTKWHGSWNCRHDKSGHLSTLTINGNGSGSNISGYYPQGWGGKPGSETYVIHNITTSQASGTYIYKDSNPNPGPTGEIGTWTGYWTISMQGHSNSPVIRLFRQDSSTKWSGSYVCTRQGLP